MDEVLQLINEMSPFLLLGFFLAGLMHAFIPGRLYTHYLADGSWRSVVYAALIGVPLPLCSCGVIPTAMSMRKEGASKGATVSFLIATPQTGVDSIFATYSLLGLPFAIIRPIAAFITALAGGQMVNIFDRQPASAGKDESHSACSHDGECTCENGECTCESDKCTCSCGTCHGKTDTEKLSFSGKLVEALRYGFIEMMGDIGKWLVIGLIIAGLITVFIPQDLLAVFSDNSMLSILLVLCISIPMYVCATGSIPIAVALMMKGLTPGAALVLLMAGPAANAASILIINKVLGRKTLMIYLASITIGAIVFALSIDYLLPREWFVTTLTASNHDCCTEPTSWFNIGCTILLAALLLYSLFQHITGHAHHHHEEENLNNTSKTSMETDIIRLHIEGMNCSHCAHSAESAIRSVAGVEAVEVSLSAKLARVRGTASADDLIAAIESIGFKASIEA